MFVAPGLLYGMKRVPMFADYERVTISASLFASLNFGIGLFNDSRYFLLFRHAV